MDRLSLNRLSIASRKRRKSVESELARIADAVGISQARDAYHASRDLLVANAAGLSAMIALSSSVKLANEVPVRWSISFFAIGSIFSLLSFVSTKFESVYNYVPKSSSARRGTSRRAAREVRKWTLRQMAICMGVVMVVIATFISYALATDNKISWLLALVPVTILFITIAMGSISGLKYFCDPFFQALAFGVMVLGTCLPLTSIVFHSNELPVEQSAAQPMWPVGSISIRQTVEAPPTPETNPKTATPVHSNKPIPKNENRDEPTNSSFDSALTGAPSARRVP